jgi:non-specific protein-tyrosine kinase
LLRRRWWIIMLAIVVCMAGAFFQTQTEHKRYATTVRLLIPGSSELGASDEITQRQLAQQRALLFAQLAPTGPIVAAATAAASADHPGVDFAVTRPTVAASASGKDPFLSITVRAESPVAAQYLANAFAPILPAEAIRLNQITSTQTIMLTVVNAASLPSSPASPRPSRNLLGIAAALARESLDTRLRDSDEVRRIADVPLLGIVPREFESEMLPALSRPHSRRSEAYRQVRTNLDVTVDGHPPGAVTVTSPGQGEGKSSITANIAVLYGRAGRRVVLVDADLRRPSIYKYFAVDMKRGGLSDVLAGRLSLDDALQPIEGENLTILPAGRIAENPSELLGSPMMARVVGQLRADFELVIFDTPPILAVTDALLVGSHTEGIVVVARMRSTTRSGLRRAIEAVERVNLPLFGVVVNAAMEAGDKRYGYGSGYVFETRSDNDNVRPIVRSADPVEEIEAEDLRPADPADVGWRRGQATRRG